MKMMRRLEKGNKAKWLNAIKTFYNVAEKVKWDQKPEAERKVIEAFNSIKLKSFCKDLYAEAINRDFVSWVVNGEEGMVGRLFYASLAQEDNN